MVFVVGFAGVFLVVGERVRLFLGGLCFRGGWGREKLRAGCGGEEGKEVRTRSSRASRL